MTRTQDIVRVEKASEWANAVGITTWTKFRYNSEPEQSIFKPLNAWGHSLRQPFYGSIIESPQEYLLGVGWQSQEDWDKFQLSPEHDELMASLTTENVQPETKVIVFANRMFGIGYTSNVEMFTVYWPPSITTENQDAIWKTQKLVHTSASGIPKPKCYSWKPSFGWVDGQHDWNAEKVIASMWCHKWKNEELEHKYKTTERRLVLGDGGMQRPLAVDAFKDDLKSLGAIGWESIHVAFESINIIGEDSTTLERGRNAEAVHARTAAYRLQHLDISGPSDQ
ncbi:hypothetical protein F53441_8176 [Fusarium austroafricanum]|uniref:Uncharacterized protein n=1 Tax=Fusarium austroafricanum TaxID=2364996 RepID=A0A8H4NWS2_9HYPO|nr:hypothetical protein F53441_8176 [Fusarium austroafricanum]